MKQVNYEPIIIFSVFKGECPVADSKNHLAVKQKLFDDKILFTEIVGCYDGKKELSFMVSAAHRHAAETLAKEFKQESILYSGPDRYSWLEFLNGGPTVPLGTLRPASRDEALEAGNYSMIDNGTDKCYYITQHLK